MPSTLLHTRLLKISAHLGKVFFHVSTWMLSHGINLPHAYSASTKPHFNSFLLKKSKPGKSLLCNQLMPLPPASARNCDRSQGCNAAEIQSRVGGGAGLRSHTLSSSWEVPGKSLNEFSEYVTAKWLDALKHWQRKKKP